MIRRSVIFLCLLAVLVACHSKDPPAGSAGPRVVSLSPAIGVLLTDLHEDHLCVGRDGHDAALHPSIPVIGDQNQIDYEALVACRPTLIFTQWGSRELPARLLELADSNHWRVVDSRLLSLDDIRQAAVQVDQEVCTARGEPAPSGNCRDLLARLDAAWTPHPGAFERLGKVLLLAQTSPAAAFGPGSCHYQLLDRLGATPAIPEGAAYINLDSEDIVQLAPDAIILISPRSPNTPPPSADEAKKIHDLKFAPLAKLDIPAAKTGRMAVIDDPQGFIPSTSLMRVGEEMNKVLKGWAGQQ